MSRPSDSQVAVIKQAVDLIGLVGDYLPLHRAGARFKALCPFHDDHRPSLELNPERQSFKCWACGAGGDVFDFVQRIERVEFPEALRMLAERTGIALDEPAAARGEAAGPGKVELLAACAWAARLFAGELGRTAEARAYVERRRIAPEQVERFGLGYAPDRRDLLLGRARRDGIDPVALERAGLVARNAETGIARDRFRGRLIFPIQDWQGRPIAFGGRVLPDLEAKWAAQGFRVAKYLNSPETPLFQKRRTLYGAHLAREAARRAGWVAVVEGYTDVVAAHQVGLANVVGTLGTALGDEHVGLLRRLADRAVLVFDGDEAGQKAAERALEIFLGHEVDVRVLVLPGGLDPCDYLLGPGGAEAFAAAAASALDPLAFALERAAERHDLGSAEGSRQASEWALGLLARVPRRGGGGLDVKLAKALDLVAERLRLPVAALGRRLAELRRAASRPSRAAATTTPAATAATTPEATPADGIERPVDPAALDPLERELVAAVLNEPARAAAVLAEVRPETLADEPLRRLLAAAASARAEGLEPGFDQVAGRVGSADRALAAALLEGLEAQPASPLRGAPAPWDVRREQALRSWRLRDLERRLRRIDRSADPAGYERARHAFLELKHRRPDAGLAPAS